MKRFRNLFFALAGLLALVITITPFHLSKVAEAGSYLPLDGDRLLAMPILEARSK